MRPRRSPASTCVLNALAVYEFCAEFDRRGVVCASVACMRGHRHDRAPQRAEDRSRVVQFARGGETCGSRADNGDVSSVISPPPALIHLWICSASEPSPPPPPTDYPTLRPPPLPLLPPPPPPATFPALFPPPPPSSQPPPALSLPCPLLPPPLPPLPPLYSPPLYLPHLSPPPVPPPPPLPFLPPPPPPPPFALSPPSPPSPLPGPELRHRAVTNANLASRISSTDGHVN